MPALTDHLRCRTSYRAPCSCQRKQNKDCPHRLNGQICKGYPEILGKKVQAHCRPCGDRRSPGRRSSGFHKEELDSYTPEAYDNEIRKIVQTVKSYAAKFGTEIPVVAAGGIATHEDVKHVLDLGVDGVQVATRFIPTEECDADIRLKESLIHAAKDDIAIVKSPVGMPGRATMNKFMTRVMNGEQIPHSSCHGCLVKCSPKEIPYCITDGLINAVKGNVDEGLLFCGAKAWKAERLQTVQEVINDLF